MSKVCVLLANGFEEIEALTVVDVLRRADVTCDAVSIFEEEVTGAHNMVIRADKLIKDISEYDAVVLPGGMPGSTNLRDNSEVIDLIEKMNSSKKIVAAICAAPIVLAKADVIRGKDVTSYPGFKEELGDVNYIEDRRVVIDGNIITSRGPATALEFSFEILKKLGKVKEAEEIRNGMLYNF
ncbi:MAG: DJ-1 family glyoxalase III [Clostridium sp.]